MQKQADLSISNKYRLGFIIEQALGHKTHAQNLRRFFDQQADMDIRWILPESQTSAAARRIPIYRSNWTVQAGFQARRGLSALHREFPFEGLFFHTQVPAVLSLDWIQRFPSVISLDATPIQYDSLGAGYNHQKGPAWLEKIKFTANQRCFQAAKHLVTWSQWTKDSLVADYGISAEKITVIPPGVDLNQWTRPEDAAKDPDTIRILFVGGNLERKGGKELLAAFEQLLTHQSAGCPRLELHLITQDLVPEKPNVFAHYGIKPNSVELKNLLFSADIFCLPTHADCLPMALAEAGAAELPIISTRVAGIPDLVHDGENGYLIQPGDVDGLITALDHLVTNVDLRSSMGLKSRRIVSSEHNLDQNARTLAGILRNVIETSR